VSSPETRRLLVVAGISMLVFLAVWAVAVGTRFGQEIDDAALTGGRSAPDAAQSTADEFLNAISAGSLIAAFAVLAVFAWIRRRPELLLLPLAVVGLSLFATELFKHVIFERPDVFVDSKHPENSYPSGHSTATIAIGLAAIVVAPPRLRTRVAIGAALLAAVGGVFVVTADWHRPSDSIGSFTLTLAMTALLLAVLRARRAAPKALAEPGEHDAASAAARVELTALLAGAALFVGSGVIASLRYGANVDWNRFHAAFLLASLVIVVAAGLCVGAFLRALPTDDARPADELG
jgi:hypothetical protein